MASGDRAAYFPAIERRYGFPMAHWFELMETISDRRYPEQMAFLQEEHGFSRTHANALVQYCRGSVSSRRFETLDDFLAEHDATKQETLRTIFDAITAEFPEAEVVIAWNQPMVRIDGAYVFGASVSKQHLNIAPFSAEVIDAMRSRLDGYELTKKTIRVPVDWAVDTELLRDLIAAQVR